MTTNGPAVKLSRRCLTKYRPQGLNFSQETVPVQGRHGAVFAVRVQIAGRIRVSRYKAGGEQVTSHVTQSFFGSSGAVRICLVLPNCLKSRNYLQKP